MNPFFIGVGLVFLSAAGFGVLPIFALYAYQGGASVTTVLFLRFLLAAAIFGGYTLFKREQVTLSRFHWISLFLLGGVLYTLQSMFYFSAVKHIPASLAALLLYTFPIYVSILSFWVDRETLSRTTILSMGLSIGGLALVLGASFGVIDVYGVLLACGAALVYSCYIVLGNRVVRQLPSMVTSTFVSLFAAFSLLVIGLSNGSLVLQIGGQAFAAIVGIALFSTVLSMLTFFQGLKLIGSTRASVLSMIEPVITSGFSALLFGERLTLWQWIGGLAVLGGATLVVATQGRRATKEAAPLTARKKTWHA